MVVSATGAESLSLNIQPVVKTPPLLSLSMEHDLRPAIRSHRIGTDGRMQPGSASPFDNPSDFAVGAQTDLPADANDDMVMQRKTQNLATLVDFLRHRDVGA